MPSREQSENLVTQGNGNAPWTLPPELKRSTAIGVFTFAVTMLMLALCWSLFGAAFYSRVLPFYDSLAYQEQYLSVTQQNASQGVNATFNTAWHEDWNTALNRLIPAILGGIWPDTKEGLYVYLFSIQFAAIFALLYATWQSTRNLTWAILAVAAWLAANPFSETIYGILDQRMDLASAAFCLMVTALCLSWSRHPTLPGALLAGLAAALAVLHRPVMAVTIAGIGIIFWFRAMLRERKSIRIWLLHLGALMAPGLLFTLPWLWAHTQNLRFYYLIWNVALGNAASLREAADYNWGQFARVIGPHYLVIVTVTLLWSAFRRRIDWLDLVAILLSIALPLCLLIVSKSVGNFLVCQIPLGLLALTIACLRPARISGSSNQNTIAAFLASALLLYITAISLHSLKTQIASISNKARLETIQALTQIDLKANFPDRILSGFQTSPLPPTGLIALAREQGINLRLGNVRFHPVDFGISNAEAPTLSDQDLQPRFAAALQSMKSGNTLLMLPTAESEHLLPPDPFAQVHMHIIRKAVEADKSFVLLLTTTPINGIALDIFVIKPVVR